MPIHVRAKEIAENVILCGDPKRVEYISKFLENPQLYTDYRSANSTFSFSYLTFSSNNQKFQPD